MKTTLVDYPGRVAAAVFLPGCHLRCPYCHNPEFVDPLRWAEPLSGRGSAFNADADDFRALLGRRAGVLSGVVFSGGEALLHPLLPDLIALTKEHGLAVKLDTAGLLPDKLEELTKSESLDFVAMDFKTLPERYAELGWHEGGNGAADRLRKTLALLAESGLDREVRTTVVPPLADQEILEEMAGFLEGTAGTGKWIWQPYIPGETLDPLWGDLAAPSEETLKVWADSMDTSVDIEVR